MNTHGTLFPGKSHTSKSKTNPKIIEAPKTKPKEQPSQRQKRVFGAIRNPNVPEKTDLEKSITTKLSIGISQKQPKSDQTTQSSRNVVKKKSPEKNRAKPSKKSVIFRENVVETAGKVMESPEKNRMKKSEVFQEDDVKTAGKVSESSEENRADPMKKSEVFQENLVETAGKVSELPEENRAKPMKKSVISGQTVVEIAGKVLESPDKNRAEPRNKSVCLQENAVETIGKVSESPEKNRAKPIQKSVIIQENVVETAGKVSESPEKNKAEPRKKTVVTRENVVETTGKVLESPEENRAKPRKKSVIFRENVVETGGKKGDTVGLRTPVRSPALIKSRSSSTPYQSAEKCSKCRFDRLETSSYWLAQIKLAEPVGKHFVSADFFRLAFESNAEPIGSLRVELKQYLKRHGHLSSQPEWKDVSLSYGLSVKEEINAAQEVDSGLGKADTSNGSDIVLDEERKDLEEATYEEIPIQKKLSSFSPEEPLT